MVEATRAREKRESGMAESTEGYRADSERVRRKGRSRWGGGDWETGLEAVVAPESVHVGE